MSPAPSGAHRWVVNVPASAPGAAVDSFYHLRAGLPRACSGLACFVARDLDRETWESALRSEPRVHCLGRCYRGPANTEVDARPRIEVEAPCAIVLERVVRRIGPGLGASLDAGAYQAARAALRRPAGELLAALEASGLRGRGGGAHPVATKWATVARQPGADRVVVANADEGDPGTFVDRFLLEEDPHRILEAMVLAGHAVGARRGIVHLRAEYPAARDVLVRAISEARDAGLLGPDVAGTGRPFDVEVHVGRGGWVCGEETALLASLAGERPSVKPQPPSPAVRGLHGSPTLVENVETLASVPWIATHGGKEYGQIGLGMSRGTKVVSLNSLFERPGLYEVPLGIPLREIVERIGGGLRTGRLKGVLVGGPLAGLLPPGLLDTALGFEELREVGASLGHGGVIGFDERTSVRELVAHALEFTAYESCGTCTPCRAGTPRLLELLAADEAGGAEWRAIVAALEVASLCGAGSGLAALLTSAGRHWPGEVPPCSG